MSVPAALQPWGHPARALPPLRPMDCCGCGRHLLVRDWSLRKAPLVLCQPCENEGSPL